VPVGAIVGAVVGGVIFVFLVITVVTIITVNRETTLKNRPKKGQRTIFLPELI
jgi:hypothetical protein